MGWAAKVGSPEYRNTPDGALAFPGFSKTATDMLAEMGVASIGVDTLSLDPGNSQDFAVHFSWLPGRRFGIENLAGLDHGIGVLHRLRRDVHHAERRHELLHGELVHARPVGAEMQGRVDVRPRMLHDGELPELVARLLELNGPFLGDPRLPVEGRERLVEGMGEVHHPA